MASTELRIRGVVVRGYGVASGIGDDGPAGGTIRLQLPHFRRMGLDLSACHPATINVSIAPRRLVMHRPRHTFPAIRWLASGPIETFSFSPCRVVFSGATTGGFVYYPHPETKPGHFHPPTTVEIVAPYVEGLRYGSTVELILDGSEVAIA